MFNTTFFKFLIAFAVIVCTSFLIMGIAGGFNSRMGTNTVGQEQVLD